MKRIAKVLGIGMVVTALLSVAIAGTAFAAGGNTDVGNQGEECPYSDCVPNFYNWDYNYESPGPHGAQNGTVS